MTKKIFRRSPCTHLHVSGRQCGQSAPPSIPLCGLHKHGGCIECDSMREMFPIRKTVEWESHP